MTWGAEGRGGFTRDVLDGLTDPVVLMAAVRDDAGVIVDFTFVDANAAALVINRTTFDELIGDTLLARFPEHGPSGLIHAYAQVIETGEPLGLNDQPYAHEFYPGDVQYFDIRAAKVGDAITLTWRDRSDLHADRQALEAERARSRTTLDGIDWTRSSSFTPIPRWRSADHGLRVRRGQPGRLRLQPGHARGAAGIAPERAVSGHVAVGDVRPVRRRHGARGQPRG